MNDKSNQNQLSNFLANLTSDPGVYRMLDTEGTVLYVGKASNLKKRVASYFNKQSAGAKTKALVEQIASVEVSITRSETEALLLESNLIKALRPKYNVLLRDDKTYPYIHVSHHVFPRMELYRSKKKPKKGEFYGPYPGVSAAKDTLNLIQKVFKIRNCSDNYFNSRSRPCLQYQIKRCTAPCTQYISSKEYQQSVNDATRFLQGKSQLVLGELAKRMEKAVAVLDFEEAALLRDQIKSLRLIQEQQGVVQSQGDADIIAIAAQSGFACVHCVTVRDGQVIASQSFFPSVPGVIFSEEEDLESALWQQVFEAFIAGYYLETPARIPGLIVTSREVAEGSGVEQLLTELRGKKCVLQHRLRGAKARWMDFAENNLNRAVAEYKTSFAATKKRFEALEGLLDLQKPIKRMECFDISHTQGNFTIASCVVFNEEGPLKRAYRRFNISDITPGDDYAAMEQVLTRRFKRLLQEQSLPDLLIIDGGKGQVTIALRVLDALGVNGVRLLGIAKGVQRKAGLERLILADTQKEITLAPDSPALHLLQHIRDEAHRFAITAHRNKRAQSGLRSSLETIAGVGPKRRKALLQRFGGIRELAKAPLEEIAKVTGINEELATRIFQHFHEVT
ncbi:MAG: excinuclease ABC subunit UvrC [Tatlockia sp.]|jgi:excinuclease ABC subunit C